MVLEARRPSHHRPHARSAALAAGRARADRLRRRRAPMSSRRGPRAPPERTRAGRVRRSSPIPAGKAGPERRDQSGSHVSHTGRARCPRSPRPSGATCRSTRVLRRQHRPPVRRGRDRHGRRRLHRRVLGAERCRSGQRLARLTVAACKGRGPAIVGTGSIRAGEVIDQIHAAKEAGADGVLVMPPYFAHLTDGRDHRAFRGGQRARRSLPDRALQHPRQRRERDHARHRRPARRPRQRGGDQGKQRATGRTSTARSCA